MVGLLEHGHLLAGDIAEYAHCQAGTRERMAADEFLVDAQRAAHGAHLVLEKEAQRLADLEVHAFGKAADVVVALDDSAGDRQAFDAVGVDGALGEPAHTFDAAGFLVEHFHEICADDFAFPLGVGHSGKVGEELLGSVHAFHVKA